MPDLNVKTDAWKTPPFSFLQILGITHISAGFCVSDSSNQVAVQDFWIGVSNQVAVQDFWIGVSYQVAVQDFWIGVSNQVVVQDFWIGVSNLPRGLDLLISPHHFINP